MRKAAERNEVARAEPKDSAAKVLYKRFTACEKERAREPGRREKKRRLERGRDGRVRENGEIRNNIVPRRDPSGKLPGGAPPAAFLETKRKLEETGGDWFQPVARRGGRAGAEIRSLPETRGSSGTRE